MPLQNSVEFRSLVQRAGQHPMDLTVGAYLYVYCMQVDITKVLHVQIIACTNNGL